MDQDRLTRSWAAPLLALLGLGLTTVVLLATSLDSLASPVRVQIPTPEAWAAVGVAWFGAALLIRRSPPAAMLAAVVGATWLVPVVAEAGVLWHRAPLVHLLLAGGSWWPRSRTAQLTVSTTYALVAAPQIWTRVDVAVGVALAIGLAAVAERDSRPGTFLRRGSWQIATLVLVAAVVTPPALARAGVGPEWAVGILVAYDLCLVLIALLVVVAARPWTQPWVTDLVVDLGQSPPETLDRVLAEQAGDQGPMRREVEEAIAAADRLRARLHERQAQLDRAVAETQESLERLASADEAARIALHADIQALTRGRLSVLVEELALVAVESAEATASCAQLAHRHLVATGHELDSLGRGLIPAVLGAGLVTALRHIQAGASLPVSLAISDEAALARLPAETAATAYFVVAESVTNAIKHARASGITVRVRTLPRRIEITVADDGVGGTTLTGVGLEGVHRRVQEVGGALSLSSPPGQGTALSISLPLPDEKDSDE